MGIGKKCKEGESTRLTSPTTMIDMDECKNMCDAREDCLYADNFITYNYGFKVHNCALYSECVQENKTDYHIYHKNMFVTTAGNTSSEDEDEDENEDENEDEDEDEGDYIPLIIGFATVITLLILMFAYILDLKRTRGEIHKIKCANKNICT